MADFKHNLNATTDVLNRGLIASNLGGPADMANVLANLARAGYGFAGRELGLLRADQLPELVEKPAFGSEHLGDVLERLGAVSATRRPGAEIAASMLPLAPLTAAQLGKLSQEFRTGRNLARALGLVENAPTKVAQQELRLMAPKSGGNEMAVAVSPKGIAGPVRVGVETAVMPGKKSRLSRFTPESEINSYHTHKMDGDQRFMLNPTDVAVEAPRASANVIHTDAANRPSVDFESVRRPGDLGVKLSDWSYVDPAEWQRYLKASGQYKTTVPEGAYNNAHFSDLSAAGFAEGGAVLQKPVMGGGWDSDYYGPEGQARYQRDLDAYNAQQAALEAAKPKLIAKDVFMAAVKPEMLDAQGKFKGPDAGVNFMLEGWTPEEAYTTASGIANGGDWTEDNRLGKPASIEQANALLDPRWREGPDNGGGVLGGLTRAVGKLAKHLLVENPATSMALTAGLAPSMGNLLQGAGMSASTAKLAAPMLTSAGKTLVGGGNLADAAKGAALSYLGNEVGGQVAGATGSDTAGQLAKAAFGTAARGRGLSIDALAMQYATGKIADLSGLPPQVATLVVNLARSKRPTTGALSQAYRQYQPAQQY